MIQTARLFEQIVLKYQLNTTQPSFKPNDDSYFYDKQINSRKIIKEIKKMLPVQPAGKTALEDAEKFNNSVKGVLNSADKFFSYRNVIIHNIGNPQKNINDIQEICNKAISQFKVALAKQTEFMNIAAPFRFGKKELDFFYKK
ncbi:MAG TPA: hypothetical protein VJI97_03565 [Candidatus Nanoarchaeia archaeon]|nr:hypothetical protein [Candidatus Nanoarchaeia archaeon]